MNTKDRKKVAKLILDPPGLCLLCQRKANYRGIWIPVRRCATLLGAPPDKHRLIGYSLCSRCVRKPDTPRKVENTLLEQARDELARPSAN